MFENVTRKEWERWEGAERSFRAHPALYRLRLAALFAEGVLAGVLLLAVVAFLVAACVIAPARHVRLIVFLVLNLFYSAKTYLSILSNRPWSGLPELCAEEWPRLHELVRETAAAVGAPRIHRVFLDPGAFNASVSVAFPLVPGLRRNVLMLGYPLLASLGPRALRGVLAHELGHVAHRDLVHGGALLHVRAFWISVQLGVFTWAMGPWRRSYLRRIDRLMSPLERERELAADRAAAELFGVDALRETLVALELRGPDADLGKILDPLVRAGGFGQPGGPSPGAAIREALRREIPADKARRRLARALRSIVPPSAEHPPLAVRAGTADPADLVPFANAPQDALETVFGAADALDGAVLAFLGPLCEEAGEGARDERENSERRLAALPDDDASPDSVIERIGILRDLGRREDAEALLRAGRAAHPDNAALEAIELSDALAEADTAEEGAPLARRLEALVETDPMMRLWAEDPLFTHYLEVGAVDSIKALLDLRQHGEKTLRRRLNAKLRPTDDLRAAPLSETVRSDLALAFAGNSVREVYAVLRAYEGTGTSSCFLVVRWRPLADSSRLLPAFNEAFETVVVLAGTRALFRRFAELGIEPIPVPKRRPKGK